MEEFGKREATEALLAARQALYALLARCWDAPLDGSTLALLASSELGMLCELVDEAADREGPSLADCRARIVESAPSVSAEDAEKAFNWFFLGVGTRLAPWESVYVSPDRLIFQASTLAVRGAYAAAGFAAKRKGSEPDDHIATECDFMAKLALRTQEAFGAKDEAACRKALETSRVFLDAHLGVLSAKFADALSEEVGESLSRRSDPAMKLYGELACFSAAFARKDSALLETLTS